MSKRHARPGRTRAKHRSLRFFVCAKCHQEIKGKPAFKMAGVFRLALPHHPDCLKGANP